MSTKLIEELEELEAREGVFYGTDKALQKMQYEKSQDLMIDCQLAEDSEFSFDGSPEMELFTGTIKDKAITFLINHIDKNYHIVLLEKK